ncbi:hypothetical protein B9Z55_006168 [Caenorhabditis nigoni]|uniref:Major sperm protein n=1 Tax=Caenorhabditis nigoni TaxID=1611254 RepID=A0A2G5V4D7_9PELO|nr:hypothetical protein B9Z55_006168 [Caenorhabditis nigoni]
MYANGDQQMIIFEDDTRDQTMLLEVTNPISKKMKFGWQTTFGFFFKVQPSTGIMEPGETVRISSYSQKNQVFQKTFEIQFQGGQLPNTDIMDSDHSIKMWLTPAETRKRGLENTTLEVPVVFAVHVQPKRVMEY